MQPFAYRNGRLCAEEIPLIELAEKYGTPGYVYSRAAILEKWQQFDNALTGIDSLVCYAVKANSNISILSLLGKQGAGFDIVSIGELERVLVAGGDPKKIVFSGVGKREDEMHRALDVGIKCFNVESIAELNRLNSVASTQDKIAPVSIRVNPDVDANTHPYIATGLKENKFGIGYQQALPVYQHAASLSNIQISGIDCHIGSQITDISPFRDALGKLIKLANEIEKKGISIGHIDIGGGLGICYQDESPPSIGEYISVVRDILGDTKYQLLIEPGRSIIGNAGVLITKVEYLKQSEDKNFAIIDAAMTELLRPALYDAWHDILPFNESSIEDFRVYDLVGPVCETSDFIARNRNLSLSEGDYLAICSVGAYGFSMASTYNSRPRCCELLVDGSSVFEIRKREAIEALMQGEILDSD